MTTRNITTQEQLQQLGQQEQDVTGVVLGTGNDQSATMLDLSDPPAWDQCFPNLRQLVIWSVSGLRVLQDLPQGLLSLEVCRAVDLQTVVGIPETLQRLVLEHNPQLQRVETAATGVTHLQELAFSGCAALSPEVLPAWIERSPQLEVLDLSQCSQLSSLPPNLARFLPQLQRLELNGCTGLQHLPARLPLTLQRLGLRGATSLKKLPDSFRDLDYLDVREAAQLTAFPPALTQSQVAGTDVPLRSLFLYNSAILAPPASEHGQDSDSNVAEATKQYFADINMAGPGKVQRCKVLLLGNGSAGKTKLALNLVPGCVNDDLRNGGHYRGTTHGIQFFNWPDFVAQTPDAAELPVHLHLWDFGGQEIYHSTHRQFVNRGSVFLLLWNPQQDNRQPDPRADGFQDRWHGLRYWLDYLTVVCPDSRPQIAIVCTHQGKDWQQRRPQLLQTLQRAVGDEYFQRFRDDNFFVLDSQYGAGEGQRQPLLQWLQHTVGQLVSAEGTMVPSYWEIAQELVQTWLPDHQHVATPPQQPRSADFAAQNKRISQQEFRDRLHQQIKLRLAQEDQETDLTKLRRVYSDDFLTSDRVRRTLSFLTHGGWLYWRRDLDDSRVIIDQAWALEWAYKFLNRRRCPIRTLLLEKGGRFTLADISPLAPFDQLDAADQRLLLSFLVSIGVIFPVGQAGGEGEFISPEHLPESHAALDQFDMQGDLPSEKVSSGVLHRSHWFAILRRIGPAFGDRAVYAKTGCLIQGPEDRFGGGTGERWAARLQFQPSDPQRQQDGWIRIVVSGADMQQRLPKLQQFVRSFLPGGGRLPSDECTLSECFPGQSSQRPKTVFFSYAWNPEDKTADYEEIVDAVERALRTDVDRGRLVLLRDRNSMKPGDYITNFIQKAGANDVDLVLMFVSDRYLDSWYCMMEFYHLHESLWVADRGVNKNVLLIQHPSVDLGDGAKVAAWQRAWQRAWRAQSSSSPKDRRIRRAAGKPRPRAIPSAFNMLNTKKYATAFAVHVDNLACIAANAVDLRRNWKADNSNTLEIIEWIRKKLGLA